MRKLMLAGLLWLLLPLCGCGTDEVENNAFPLAVGVGLDAERNFEIHMAYPDLQDQDARENAVSSDVFWSGSARDLFAGADEMSENSSKNVDFNHLKVLILKPEVLEQEQTRGELISFFMENKDAAWNTYVMFAEGELADLFSDELKTGSSLGIYLEDLVEEWTNIRSGALVTVGDFMSQFYNGNETALVPLLAVEGDLPAVRAFVAVKDLQSVCTLPREDAYAAMLMRNQLKAFSFATEDGIRVTMHLISVEKELSETANERMPEERLPLLEIRVRAVAQIKNRPLLSEREKQEIRRRAEGELADRLTDLAVSLQENYHVDAADSFVLLPGYQRSLWRLYGSNRNAYEKKLQYHVEAELSRDEQTV